MYLCRNNGEEVVGNGNGGLQLQQSPERMEEGMVRVSAAVCGVCQFATILMVRCEHCE